MTSELPNLDDVPDALADREQWVCWESRERDGKATKVPLDPATGAFASSTDDTTWASFTAARRAAADGTGDGVGFVFTATDPFVGVDLDDCRVPETGSMLAATRDVVDRLDSYAEVSPSGTGYHVIVRGELPEGRNRRGDVELYDRARYFTVTGQHCEGTPGTVEERTEELAAVHEQFVADDDDACGEAAEAVPAGTASVVDSSSDGVDLSDAALLERAKAASNGDAFGALWTGSTAGYDSHSEADMALCCHLAFWTGGDPSRVDALFRQSGLYRDKWDEPHYADGRTYGAVTASRAVTQVDETYDPDGAPDGSVDGASSAVSTLSRDSARVAGAAGDVRSSGSSVEQAVGRDVDVLYERVCELSAAVERLEVENERLRDELADVDETADGSAATSVRSGSAGIGGVFASIRRRLTWSN